jgi:hypothetical protein
MIDLPLNPCCQLFFFKKMGPDQNDGLGQGPLEIVEMPGEKIITSTLVMCISLDFIHW